MKLKIFKERCNVFGIVGHILPLIDILIIPTFLSKEFHINSELLLSHGLQVAAVIAIILFIIFGKDKLAQKISTAHWCLESVLFAIAIVESALDRDFKVLFVAVISFLLVTSFAIGELIEEKVKFNVFIVPSILSVVCFAINIFDNVVEGSKFLGYITAAITFASNVFIALWLSEHYREIYNNISNKE